MRYRLFLSVCRRDRVVNNMFGIYNRVCRQFTPELTNNVIKYFSNDVLIGGTNLKDVATVVRNNRLDYHGTIINFAEEGLKVDDGKPDLIIREIIDGIKIAAKYDKDPIVAIKTTAFTQIDFVRRMNDLFETVNAAECRAVGRHLNARQEKLVSGWAMADSVTGPVYSSDLYEHLVRGDSEAVRRLFPDVTQEDIDYAQIVHKRLVEVFERGLEHKCYLIIDSEQTYFQYFIDYLMAYYSKQFNKEFPTVMKTTQSYLKNSIDVYFDWFEFCKRNDITFSMKLVRGAYMAEEIPLAEKNNDPSPVWDTLENTHKAYDTVIRDVYANLRPQDKFIFATHNMDSVLLICRLHERKRKNNVMTATLFGLGEQLNSIAKYSGVKTLKYLPYAEIGFMIPYLIRRAEESSITTRLKMDIAFVDKELYRRSRIALLLLFFFIASNYVIFKN